MCMIYSVLVQPRNINSNNGMQITKERILMASKWIIKRVSAKFKDKWEICRNCLLPRSQKDKYTRQIKNFYIIMRFDMGEGLNTSLLVVDRESMRATSKSRSWSLADIQKENADLRPAGSRNWILPKI